MLNSNITFVPVDPRLKFFHLQNSLGLDFLEDPIRISDERNAELAPNTTFTQRGDPRQRAMAYKGPRTSNPGAQIFGNGGRGRLHGQTLGVRIVIWAGREVVLENGDLESGVRVG